MTRIPGHGRSFESFVNYSAKKGVTRVLTKFPSYVDSTI
jgi:hypothetical protein